MVSDGVYDEDWTLSDIAPKEKKPKVKLKPKIEGNTCTNAIYTTLQKSTSKLLLFHIKKAVICFKIHL